MGVLAACAIAKLLAAFIVILSFHSIQHCGNAAIENFRALPILGYDQH